MELASMHTDGELRKHVIKNELDQIIADSKSHLDHFVPDASDVNFLDTTSESILTEAKRINIISESTYGNILLLQRNEIKHFKAKNDDNANHESKDEVESITASSRKQLQPGQICYFMNRFLITWKLSKNNVVNDVSEKAYCGCDHDMFAEVRHMIEYDWLYLAKLSKSVSLDDLHQQRIYTTSGMGQTVEKMNLYLDYLRFSAERALTMLKSIPLAARRSLPVLANHQGELLSIPVSWPL